MTTTLTLVPAYGRDYTKAAEVLVDFGKDRDFLIATAQHPYDGRPVNRSQLVGVLDEVRIRYDAKRKVVILPVGSAA